MGGKRVLYIVGFNSRTTARELADEFERYGRVNRCDIPAASRGDRFAFLEYDQCDDAEEAYRKMHEKRLRCGVIRVEWAKRIPRSFREEEEGRPRRRSRSRSRSPSRSRSVSRSRSITRSRSVSRSPSPARGRSRSRSPMDEDQKEERVGRSRSPLANGGRSRSRSVSPIRSPDAN